MVVYVSGALNFDIELKEVYQEIPIVRFSLEEATEKYFLRDFHYTE